MERRLSDVARMPALVLAIAGSCVALACNATGPKAPREEPLALTFLSSAPASANWPLLEPAIEMMPKRFSVSTSFNKPSSAWGLTAVLLRRQPDTLIVEIRGHESDQGGLALVWRSDYKAESPAITPGAYRLRWWHVLEGTGTPRIHILDTSIVIPPSP